MKLQATLLFLLLILPAPQESEETELARHMERIEDAMRPLRRAVRAPETMPAALEALVEIQRATLECKGLAPVTAARLPEPEREAYVLAYRRTMVDFLTRQLELETALLDGDVEAARAAFERLHDMEDSGHERFALEEH